MFDKTKSDSMPQSTLTNAAWRSSNERTRCILQPQLPKGEIENLPLIMHDAASRLGAPSDLCEMLIDFVRITCCTSFQEFSQAISTFDGMPYNVMAAIMREAARIVWKRRPKQSLSWHPSNDIHDGRDIALIEVPIHEGFVVVDNFDKVLSEMFCFRDIDPKHIKNTLMANAVTKEVIFCMIHTDHDNAEPFVITNISERKQPIIISNELEPEWTIPGDNLALNSRSKYMHERTLRSYGIRIPWNLTKRYKNRCYHCKIKKAACSTLRRCSQCKWRKYCSRNCQKRSWNMTHRFECNPHLSANA